MHAVLGGEAILRRNYQDLTFCPQDKSEDLRESRRRTTKALRTNRPDMRAIDPAVLGSDEQLRLVEKRFLPPSFAKLTEVALAINEQESLSAVMNTGEHLLMQARDDAGQLEALVDALRHLEQAFIQPDYPFAHDERFGYLSYSPVLAGSGLHLSLVMHLPMLGFLKQIRALGEPLKERLNCQLKPFFQEKGRNPGNLFILSNISSFGLTDEDILVQLRKAAALVAGKESGLRDKAFHATRVTPLADQAWRAYGTLRYARRLTRNDFLVLWSKMRLGAKAGILPVPMEVTDRMLIYCGDSRYMNNGGGQKTCPFRRADEVRQALSGGKDANIR